MWIVDELTGDIRCRQGDSGRYRVDDLPTDKNYKLSFALQTKKRKPIGKELTIDTAGNPTVVMDITPSTTDVLTVPSTQETEEYLFGFKIWDEDGFEDTLILGNKSEDDLNIITVLPKIVEGGTNG